MEFSAQVQSHQPTMQIAKCKSKNAKFGEFRFLDTYPLNVSHNHFKKVYRAKTPSTQSKESNVLFQTLAAFAPLRES